MKYRLGIIGCGTMASAVLRGALKSGVITPSEVIVSCRHTEKLQAFAAMGIAVASDNAVVGNESEYVLFGVKPQQFQEVSLSCGSPQKVISIMAGLRGEKIRNAFPNAPKVARCMPNLPCVIGEGVTAIDLSDFSREEGEFLCDLLRGTGKVVVTAEEKLDAVTGISGSGPAYVYLFLQSLISAGIQQGLTEQEARSLAFQTVKGGTALAEQSEKPIFELIQAVCSKGGTTIEAMRSFESDDFSGSVSRAVEACVKRSKELSK